MMAIKHVEAELVQAETLSITHKAEKASNPLVGSSRKTSGGEWTTPEA